MKNLAPYALLLLIALMVGFGLYKIGHKRGVAACEAGFQLDSIRTVYDTVSVSVNVEAGDPVQSVPAPVPSNIDTAAEIQDRYTSHTYEINHQDKNIKFTLKPVIFKNRIDTFDLKYSILRPLTENFYSLKPKSHIAAGISAGNRFLGPRVEFHSKGQWHFGAEYNLLKDESTVIQKFKVSATYNLFTW